MEGAVGVEMMEKEGTTLCDGACWRQRGLWWSWEGRWVVHGDVLGEGMERRAREG